MKVILRPYNKESDYGFILSTWQKSVYFKNRPPKGMRSLTNRSKWFARMLENVNAHLHVAKCIVAVSDENTDHIFGFAVEKLLEPGIEFLYVKRAYRANGIEELLRRSFAKSNE